MHWRICSAVFGGICGILSSTAIGHAILGSSNQPAPKAMWQVRNDGAALNLQSHLECPATAGEFHRITLFAYSPFGIDVSCGYQNINHDTITFYIALRGNKKTLDQEFAESMTTIVQRIPTASPLENTDQANFVSDLEWRHMIYRVNGVRREGVWMTRFGGWNVKFRATYAASRTEPVFAAMAHLSATGQKTAGRHIARCYQMAPTVRNGQPIVNGQMLPGLSISGALTIRNGSGPNLPNWCVVQTLIIGGARYLLWRNSEDQKGGAADRITSLNESVPVVFSVADANSNSMLKDGDKPIAPYDIDVDTPEAIQLVGIYEGRPTIQQLVRFTQQSRFVPYASVDKKTGKATILRQPQQSGAPAQLPQ